MKFPDAESLPPVNDLRVVRLRAELWVAAQVLKGNDLEHVKALVGELVQYFDMDSPVTEPPPAVPWGPEVKKEIEQAAVVAVEAPRVPDPTTESLADRTAELERLRNSATTAAAVVADAQASSNRYLEARRVAEAESTRLRAVLRRIAEGGRHLDAAAMAQDALGPEA